MMFNPRLFILSFLLVIACVYHDADPIVIVAPDFSCDTISWQKHIQPLMRNTCATNGCHDGISRLDWRDYALVKQYSSLIRSKTVDRSMPVDSRLSQQEIDMVSCWVDKGSPNN
jgi:hypothetical protein